MTGASKDNGLMMASNLVAVRQRWGRSRVPALPVAIVLMIFCGLPGELVPSCEYCVRVLLSESESELDVAIAVAAEEGLEAKFSVAHPQDPLDGAFAQFACQGQDIRGDTAKLLVQLLHAVQFACLRG